MDAELRRDLGKLRLLDVVFDQRGARLWRQRIHGAIQQDNQLFALQLDLEIERIGKRFRSLDALWFGRSFKRNMTRQVAAALASPAPADIAGDAGQPLGALLRVTQSVEVPPGFQKGLLSQVLGGPAVPRHRRTEAHQPRALLW